MALDNILTIVTIILGVVQFIGVFAYRTLNDKCERLEGIVKDLNEKVEEEKEKLRTEISEQNNRILQALEGIKTSISDIKIDLAKNYVDYEVFSKTLKEMPCRRFGLGTCPGGNDKL